MSASKHLLALAAGVSAFAISSAAWAAAADNPNDVSEVVVTGSRIVRNGYSTPTPVTVANIEQLQTTTPSNIPDALNKLPSFVLSKGQGNLLNGSMGGSGNYLNLRAFGIARTLILLDGRRVPASSFDSTVDVNTLPQLLVQRVDVVTGGASAVYGSDAVTGVVNFVLDKNFTGLKGVVQGGISSRGDAKSYRVGIAGGGKLFDDRGHFIWSYEHYQNDGLKNKEDRSFGPLAYTEQGAGSAASPIHLVTNTRVSNTSFGGLVLTGPFAGQQFLPGGTLGPFNAGTPSGVANIASGGDGAYTVGGTLISRLRTDQAFGRFEYELTPQVNAFVQLSYAETRNANRFSVEQHSSALAPLTIFSGNAFLTPAEQAQLTAANTASFTVARYGALDFPKSENDPLTTGLNATVGLNGKLFDSWSWDTYYTHAEGRLRLPTYFNTYLPKFYAAVDAVKDPTGKIVCRVTLTNPGNYPGCVPLNLFGVGAPSQAAEDYVLGETEWQAINKTDDVALNVTGDVFSTWAGPISVALGGEFRHNSLNETTDASPQDTVASVLAANPSLAGIRGFTGTSQIWRTNVVAASRGHESIEEADAETVVPLARGLPFAKSLEINGAARYTHYSTSGGTTPTSETFSSTTWKIGLNYQPVDDLRIRATRSRDIRAPSLFDLYAGQQLSPTGFSDIHTGTSGITSLISGGNPNLVPEVANTTTIGAVYSPSFLKGFTISVDYYNITIANALALVTATAATSLNECENSGGASPLCALYQRPLPFSNKTSANFPTAIFSQNLNVAQTYTHGIDVEATYVVALADLYAPLQGNLDLHLLGSYQPVLKVRNFASAPVTNTAGAEPIPSKRATFLATYTRGPLSVDLQTRYFGKTKQNGNPALVFTIGPVPAYTLSDLSVEYQFKVRERAFTGFVSISNVFDKQPPLYAEPAVGSVPGLRYPVPGQTDIVGRYFTSGLRFRF